MLPSSFEILNVYYSESWTLDKFIKSNKFCDINITGIAESLNEWLKSIFISFPFGIKKFKKPKTIQILQNYERHILPTIIKLKKYKSGATDDIFNLTVKNEKGRIIEENWKFFQTSQWIEVHKLVGDDVINYILLECAIFKRESTTLIQKSGYSMERLNLNSNLAKKEMKQIKIGKKRPFPENETQKKEKLTSKKRKIEKKKGKKNKQKIVPGFQHSFNITYARVMYKVWKHEKFPVKHVLNTQDVVKLKKSMFSKVVTDQSETNNDLVEHLYEIEMALNDTKIDVILAKFMRNHKNFKYGVCLSKNSPIVKNGEITSKSFNERSQVLNFLRLILHQVVPKEFFGSGNNLRVMYRNLKTLIFSGRYDKLCLGQFMMNIKVKECKWITKQHGISLREKFVAKMITWFVTDYFMVILKNFFYITDTSFGGNQLYYYRQSKWRKLCRNKVDELIKTKILEKIENKQEIEKFTVEGYGVGKLRFIPKNSGLRPLVALVKKNQVSLDKLRHVLCVLKYAIRKNPLFMGFGTEDVRIARQKWQQFKKSIGSKNLKFYFVKVDVNNCFHTIIQKKILEILENVYEYLYKNNTHVQIAEIDEFKLSHNGIFRRRMAVAGDMRDSFETIIPNNRNVIVDTGRRFFMKKPSLRSRLTRYICSLVCTVAGQGKSIFHQTEGIVQGQMLSSMLCNIYYGAMDEEYLSMYRKRAENLLIRVIDDYLFVTPDIDEANRFLIQMTEGFNDYNCKVNSSKCCTNLSGFTEIYPEIKRIEDNAQMTWLGSKIDLSTLDIFADYLRYSGLNMESTIVRQFSKPTTYITEKLLNSLKTKCYEPVYFDERCNSIQTVIQNVYELFLITAYRFVCYIRFTRRKKSKAYILSIINTISISIYEILCRLKKKYRIVLSLTKTDVFNLSLLAFETKFLKLLTWRPLGRRIRNRRVKIAEKQKQEFVNSVNIFPHDFANIKLY